MGDALVGVLAVAGAVGEGEEDRYAAGRGALQGQLGGHEHLLVLKDGGVELEAALGGDHQLRARAFEHDLRRAGIHTLFVSLEILHEPNTPFVKCYPCS